MKTRLSLVGVKSLRGILVVLLMASCSPTQSEDTTSKEVIDTAQSVAATYVAQTLTAIPTETPTPSPTATPSVADVILPEGTGTLTKIGDHWFFTSPLDSEIGKIVQVQNFEHFYSDGTAETWLVLTTNPQ